MEIKGIDWNLDGYKNKAHFFLCGAFESFEFVHFFIKQTKEWSWILKDNAVIDCVFGSPTCIWNGGRALPNTYYNKQQLQFIHDAYAELGVKVRFVFTNSLLTKYDLYDRYCNLLMDLFQDLSPEVVVNSLILEDYLRSKYPTVFFVSSTTKRLCVNEEQLREFDFDYKYICLDYDYNCNFEFLENLCENDRSRAEILVNSTCPKRCAVRVLHQEYSAKKQLEYDTADNFDYKGCPLLKLSEEIPFSNQGYTKDYLSRTNYILPQNLNKYIDMGYSHFKIQGRELRMSQLFAEFFPYLIKPEFYPVAISMIMPNEKSYK